MQNILVTSIGSMSSRIITESLHAGGYRIVGTNFYPEEYVAEARLVDRFRNLPRSNRPDEYADAIKELLKCEKIDYVFPLTDPEIDILNAHREELSEGPWKLCFSGPETIRLCRDKKAAYEYLKEHVPEVLTVPVIDPAQINEKTAFPLITKPRHGRSSEGFRIIENIEEWMFIKENSDLDDRVIQPYINGDVVCVDIIRNASSSETYAMPRREILRAKNGAGLSVHVFSDDTLTDTCRKIADVLDVNGCVNFEFIMKDNRPEYMFLECNPRFSGGLAFSQLCGYDFVMNHLRCFDGTGHIDEMKPYKSCYISKMYTETVTRVE